MEAGSKTTRNMKLLLHPHPSDVPSAVACARRLCNHDPPGINGSEEWAIFEDTQPPPAYVSLYRTVIVFSTKRFYNASSNTAPSSHACNIRCRSLDRERFVITVLGVFVHVSRGALGDGVLVLQAR